jgi:hypothetical protein
MDGLAAAIAEVCRDATEVRFRATPDGALAVVVALGDEKYATVVRDDPDAPVPFDGVVEAAVIRGLYHLLIVHGDPYGTDHPEGVLDCRNLVEGPQG